MENFMLIEMQKLADMDLPVKQWPTYDGKMLDRSKYMTSSTVAQCLRKSFYDRQVGSEGVFIDNGFAQRGHAIEAWLVEKLSNMHKHGYQVLYAGKNQRSFYDVDLGISGTPDGLVRLPNNGEYVIIEIKSIDPRTNKGNLPKPAHIMQVQQNIFLVANCLGIEINRGFLLYIDASNLFEQYEFEIAASEDIENIVMRAQQVEDAKSAEDLPAEGIINSTCDYCQNTAACSVLVAKQIQAVKASGASFFEGDSLPDVVRRDFTDEENTYLDKFLSYDTAAKENEDLAKIYKPAIKNMIAERGGSFSWQGALFSLQARAGLVTFDKDKVQALCDMTQTPMGTVQKVGAPFTVMAVKV
jgi:CRISPR/Cas system-associated exonuclease Cas4 (RecB family)